MSRPVLLSTLRAASCVLEAIDQLGMAQALYDGSIGVRRRLAGIESELFGLIDLMQEEEDG